MNTFQWLKMSPPVLFGFNSLKRSNSIKVTHQLNVLRQLRKKIVGNYRTFDNSSTYYNHRAKMIY